MSKKPMQPLSVGYHIFMAHTGYDTTDACAHIVNMDLAQIQREAKAAGLVMTDPVMAMYGKQLAILYRLTEDPSFRPPM